MRIQIAAIGKARTGPEATRSQPIIWIGQDRLGAILGFPD